MWSSQSPEPGALSLFIGGLGSVLCEGLAPCPNLWQNEASLSNGVLVLGGCSWAWGFVKGSGARVVSRLCGGKASQFGVKERDAILMQLLGWQSKQ